MAPLVLKQIGQSNSLLVSCILFPAHSNLPITVNALIDCGCSTYGFVDSKFIARNLIQTYRLPRARSVLLADGETKKPVTHYFTTRLKIGHHVENALFYIIDLSPDTPVIIGLPWLQQHNPDVDWSAMSMMFTSQHCRRNCLPDQLSPELAVAPPACTSKPRVLNAIRNPPPTTPATSNYRPPTVEDCIDETPITTEPEEMFIEQTLTPGNNHYRTRSCRGMQGDSHQAQMIPNQPSLRPQPVRAIAGARRRTPPPAKPRLPPLSAPVPRVASTQAPSPIDQFRELDVRYSTANSFLAFCRNSDAQVMKVTWDELDKATPDRDKRKRFRPALPDLTDDDFRNILLGRIGPTDFARFPIAYHDFLHECRVPFHLNRVSDADIETSSSKSNQS